MKPLDIRGAWAYEPPIHRDHRGLFLEWFRGAEFENDLGHRLDVAQANCSVSRRGVLRGIHFKEVPPGQAKYVTCLSGAVLDVIIDVRVGSPGFGAWEAVRLDDESKRAVYLSEGLGHAFMALSDQATVMYLCSTSYAPEAEHGLNPFDPAIGIAWPTDIQAHLSDKDAAAPTLDQARESGLLPDYDECMRHAARLRAR